MNFSSGSSSIAWPVAVTSGGILQDTAAATMTAAATWPAVPAMTSMPATPARPTTPAIDAAPAVFDLFAAPTAFVLAVACGGSLVRLDQLAAGSGDPGPVPQCAAEILARHHPGARRDPEAPPLPALRRQLAEYFAARRRVFELPLAPAGTDFERRVWQELTAIPYGE